MATHSSIFAWWIPWTEKPGRLQSVGSQRVRHNWHFFHIRYVNPVLLIYPSSHLSILLTIQFSSVAQSCPLFATPWAAARQASLSITNCRSLLISMSIESVMPSNHRILCPPLLLLPSIFPNIRVFSNESALRIRWPKYWSFSFSISPSNEHPGRIFRMDWLDLLVVQGTLKSLLQHHISKASILQRSAFFTSPTLTSIHDYWKNHSFDNTHRCWQSNVSAF